MTQISYLWNGTTIGDASEAPYFANELNKYLCMPQLISDNNYGYVVPGYLEDLRVTYVASGVWGVNVAPGAALFNNLIYHNDDNVGLAIDPPDNDYGRYDYVVLRYDRISQTGRLAIVKGDNKISGYARPTPVLTQNLFVWEVPLALVLVYGTEAETVITSVLVEDIDTVNYVFYGSVQDKRRFLPHHPDKDVCIDSNTNLIKNSEFLAASSLTGNYGPELWTYTGTTITFQAVSSGDRARACGFKGILETTAPVVGKVSAYTLKGKLSFNTNPVAYCVCKIYAQQDNGAEVQIHQLFWQAIDDPTTAYPEFSETFYIPDTVVNIIGLRIELTSDNNGYSTTLAQFILVPGYNPGPFREFHEVIQHKSPITDAAWTDTAKSSGTTTISLATSFQLAGAVDAIEFGVHGILLRIRGRDSASAATPTITMAIRGYAAPYNVDYAILELGSITNDTYREMNCVIPVNTPYLTAHLTVPQFRVVIVASGAGTFDATIEIVGVIT